MRFTRITYRSSTPRRAGNPQVQPVPEVMSDFQRMVGDMMGTPLGQAYPPPRMRSAHPLAPFGPGPMMADGFQEYPGGPQRMGGGFTFSTHRQLWPRDANGPQPVADPVTDIPGYVQNGIPKHPRAPSNVMFDSVFQMMMQGLADPHTRTVPGGFPDTQQTPPNPFAALFATLLNPGAAAHGDAVYTQEALDRVISQLMEQNAGSNAPGPAPEAAIASLPTKKVDLKMLGDEGKAECSVCMDEVPLGDEVTSLPCSHWFHTACATAWLNEHDTCPICRKGITPKDGNASTSRMPGQEARHAEPWRRPSASSSRRTSTGLFAGPRSLGVMPEDQAGSSTRPTPRRTPTSDRRRSHGGAGESGEGGGISGRLRGWFGGGGS